MAEFTREEKLLQQLVKAREAVKRKYNLIKTQRDNTARVLNEVFKPIIDPLETLAQDAKRVEKSKLEHTKMEQVGSRNETLEKRDVAREDSQDISFNRSVDERDNSQNESFFSTQTTDGSESNDTIQQNENLSDLDSVDDRNSPNYEISSDNDDDDGSVHNKSYIDVIEKYRDRLDKIYGVRKLNDRYTIGNLPITFEPNTIKVGDAEYPKTNGLMELLIMKHPDESVIKSPDKINYRNILMESSAHRCRFNPNDPIRIANSRKFNEIIDPLFKKKRGDGLPLSRCRQTDENSIHPDHTVSCPNPDTLESGEFTSGKHSLYDRSNDAQLKHRTSSNNIYNYSEESMESDPSMETHYQPMFLDDSIDPNDLVDRLRVLVAGVQEGHLKCIGEINSILNELRDRGYIF